MKEKSMKKIFRPLILLLGLSLGISSCDFDVMNYQDIPTEDAYGSIQDVQNGMNGAYWALGTYRFYGRNVVALGDFASDIALASASSGHFYAINTYSFTDTSAELEEIWEYGYKVMDRCVRTIQGGKDVIARKSELNLDDADIAEINLYIAQCYALKALATFKLVNIFSLPYQKGRDNLGIALLTDKPLEEFVNIKRSTVGETYDLILSDIENAHQFTQAAATGGVVEKSAFYMNQGAIYALEARVNLYMGNDETAKTTAEKAIAWKGTGLDKPTNEAYVSMWTSLSITDEDIFTICKTENDNLSANALNTLYGSYGGALEPSFAKDHFSTEDIRLGLIDEASGLKFAGLPTSAATSNIPVFRKSEMYLIIAEVEAKAGNIVPAQTALFYTAKRDLKIKVATDLPSTKEALLDFISEENVREFFQEGHRYYDARRNGELISVATGTENFDVSSFVYPIPQREMNAGFIDKQNEGWADNKPK